MVMPRERLIGWLFVAPATLLIALFALWPCVNMVLLSVQPPGWTAPADTGFVGLENYGAVVRDDSFRQSVRNTCLFAVLVVVLQTALALSFAVWTNRPGGTSRFLRLAVFLPTTISLAVLSVVWKLIYEPATPTGAGLLNGLLRSAGVPAQPLLTSPQQALPAIVAMSVWQGVGLQMMIFLSGLQQIPEQLYEAARLDGAGGWRQFRHVTLPGIAPTAVFVFIITTIFALKLFVQPFLMTRGGPAGATMSVVQYVYEAAFFRRDLSLACAAAVLFFLAVLAVALLQRFLFRKAEALQ